MVEILDKLVNGLLVLGGVYLGMGILVFVIVVVLLIWIFLRMKKEMKDMED